MNSNRDLKNGEKMRNVLEFEIIRINGKKEKLRMNLNDDFHSKINAYCKQKNYEKIEKNLLLKQIKQKVGNLEKEIGNGGERVITNDKDKKDKKIKRNKSYDFPIKKNKFCKTKGDELGQKLYLKEIEHQKNKQKKLNEIRAENSKLSNDITFHPQISKRSREITKNFNNKIKVEDRLIALGKASEIKKLQKIAEKSFNERNDIYDNNGTHDITYDDTNNNGKRYLFCPKINEYNLTRNKSEDIFIRLYKSADVKKKKIEKLNKLYYKRICPFKPKISKKSEKMNNDEYNKIIKRYYNKIEEKENDILEEQNIKKLKNKIGTNRNKKKGKNDISIINKSADYYKNRDLKRIKIENKRKRIKQIENQKYAEEIKKDWNDYLSNMINQKKEEKMKEIFHLLDRNNFNYISFSNITYYNIPPELMISLTPLIDAINKNKNIRINYQDFKNIIGNSLLSSMSEE